MEPQRDPRDAPPPAHPVADTETEDLRAALDDAQRRATDAEQRAKEEQHRSEGYLALLKRERADFTNYRRRVEQERAEHERTAAADLILALLPTLDALERALHNVPAELAGSPWVEGIRLIARTLREALERAGLARIDTMGQRFNPQVHEALLEEEEPGRSEGEIVREVRPGYRLGERVLRPAQVSVASGIPSAAAARPQDRDGAAEPPP